MSAYWSDLLDLGIHFDMIGDVKSGKRTVGFWDIERKMYYGARLPPTATITLYIIYNSDR